MAVGTQPEFSQVKLAAEVMIKAAKQLVAGGCVALLEDPEYNCRTNSSVAASDQGEVGIRKG